MPRYVAFLKGMNLGKRRVAMSRLRELFEQIGFANVETFIASGNILFDATAQSRTELEQKIARHLEAQLDYEVQTFVRTAAEVRALAAMKTFPDEGQPGITIHIGFLHEKLPNDIAGRFAAIKTKDDALRVIGREYLWLCRIRTNESKLWSSPELRLLRLPPSSMRNLTSLRKLVAKHLPNEKHG